MDRPSTAGRRFVNFCPGTNYFDIAALDVYGSDFNQSYYTDLLKLAAGKPIALAEVGPPPAPAVLDQQPEWTWWMAWAGMSGGRLGGATNTIAVLVSNPRSLSLDDPAYRAGITPMRKASGLPPLD